MRHRVSTDSAPKAIGPYTQAIVSGGLLFVSGQIPLDPSTGELVAGDIAAQTKRVMENLAAILKAGGASFDQVVKTTVYLVDLADFAVMNEVYGSYVKEPAPARATVQVVRLPKDARVEIDAVATVDFK